VKPSTHPLFCVLLPAHNEAAHIDAVVRAVLAQGFAAVVVDDGSTDFTARVAGEAGALVLQQPVNQGKGAALTRGFAYATEHGFEGVITMDADGQHDPASLHDFVDAFVRTGIPVLVGNRMSNPGPMPRHRRLTNRFMSWLICRHMRQFIPDTQNGYRLYHSSVLPLLRTESSGFAAESEVLLRLDEHGIRMDWVPVAAIYGAEQSSIRPVRDTMRFLRMMLRFLFRR
jgi:glycosyltransferase involved in cell wall biosynthesis